MLNALVSMAVRYRGVVIALTILAVAYGILSFGQTRWGVFPEFAPPQAIVQTEVPGFSPEQVETLVTRPLEDSLAGASGLTSMRSKSIQGLSMITLTFKQNSEATSLRQSIGDRLSRAVGNLPTGAHPPVLLPLSSSAGVVLIVGITSKKRTLTELRTLADWTIKPQLLASPGVSDVAIFGGDVRQLQIQVHPDALARFRLSLRDIADAARRATSNIGLGFVENSNQRIILTPNGVANTAADIASAPLRSHQGNTLRLGDVATVTDGIAPPSGSSTIMGQPGVTLVISEQYGADTLKVTAALEQRLSALKPALSSLNVNLYPKLFRPATFIETATQHLATALLLGAVFIILVLFAFLRHTRAAVISAVTIPLSLLTAVVVIGKLGYGLNTMTLGGLAIALGEVVDDAIIDVENILRRLRINRTLESPEAAWKVVVAASLEVRSAVIYATIIVALAFIPVLTLTGVAGRLFAPLGLAYIISIAASLIVALTVTPALALTFLSGNLRAPEPPLQTWLRLHYQTLLRRVETHRGKIVPSLVVLVLLAVGTLPFLHSNFLPQLREGHYIVHMRLASGASLKASESLGIQVTKALIEIPGVRSVAQRIGRASQIEDPAPIFSSEFDVDLKALSGSQQQNVLSQIDQALTKFVGATFSVNTFLSERIQETLSGYTAPVVVNIYGKNLDVLDQKASEVALILSKIKGASNIQIQAPKGEPELSIRLLKTNLIRFGIAPSDVLETIQMAYSGIRVGQVIDGDRIFDVDVILPPSLRQTPLSIGDLPISAPDGRHIPLSSLASINMTNGRFMVLHEGGQRVQAITVALKGISASDFTLRAEKLISTQVQWPPETYPVFSGDAAAQSAAKTQLLAHSALAAVGVVLLLYLALRNMSMVALVLVNLPFALVGGIAVAALSGGILSLGGLIGFVTLFGISVRNSIMLMSHYRHLVENEGASWTIDTAYRGASERLVPILMTAIVTALGLAPLAITSGAPGNEIEGPMAAVILGGLITSTALNLVILPTLSARWLSMGRQVSNVSAYGPDLTV